MLKRALLPLLFVFSSPAWSACALKPVVLVEISVERNSAAAIEQEFIRPLELELQKLQGVTSIGTAVSDTGLMEFEFEFGQHAATEADKAQVEAAFSSLRRILPHTREPIRFSIGTPKLPQDCAAKPNA